MPYGDISSGTFETKTLRKKHLNQRLNKMEKSSSIYSIRKTRYQHATHHLTGKQVEMLFNAAETAYELTTPLNRFFTIHFDDYTKDKRPQIFMNTLMGNIRKWLRRQDIEVAYLYVLENAPIKGIHVHLLIHIPAGAQVRFKKALRRWLPFECTKQRVDVQRIDYPPYGALNALNPIYGRLKYICKGVKPNETYFDIKPKPQGTIMGRRYGISKLLRVSRLHT